MMIRYITLVMAMMMCISAMAKDDVRTHRYDTGYYSTLGGGIGFGRFGYENISDPLNKDTKQSDAFTATYGLGYQKRMDEKWLLGLQGLFNYHDHSLGRDKYEAGTLSKKAWKLHYEYSYGMDGIVGFIHGPCMVYGKAGIEFTSVSYKKSIFNRENIKVSFKEDAIGNDKQSHTHTGLALGLGYDVAVSDRISLGGEIKHIFYDAKKYTHYKGTQNEVTHKIQPQITRLMATMTCRF